MLDGLCRIDFETYSEAKLKSAGAARYAEHPSTDIICLRWEFNRDEAIHGWSPYDTELGEVVALDALFEWVRAGGRVEAHGALFEFYIWNGPGRRLYGFPPLAIEQMECSMARAARRALPLALETLAEVTGAEEQKDTVGAKAMRLLAGPAPKVGRRLPQDHPEAFQATYDYCGQDIRTEGAASDYCGPLTPSEARLWALDMQMQVRGLRIDQELCRSALTIAAEARRRLLPRVAELTDWEVTSPDQVAAVLDWLRARGVHLDNLQKDEVSAAVRRLEPGSPERELLELRQALGSKSHSKYKKSLEIVCADGRAHGCTQYHGAGTGRNSGRLNQPQNFRRPVYCKDMHVLAAAIKTRDVDFLEAVTDYNAFEALADAVRGTIISEDDAVLISGDFASIEAVVTAAIANEVWKVQLFRDGGDPYCAFASKAVGREVLPKDHPDVTDQDKFDRQAVGKPGELAFGFQGGIGAWRNFDSTDRFTDDEVADFRDAWRAGHPRITNMWSGLDYCAINAVLHPGQVYTFCAPGLDPEVHSVRYVARGDFLLCRLPSGRNLHYYKPSVRSTAMPWTTDDGKPVFRPQVWYWTMREGRWQHVKGYGGHWTENVVQATARDLLVPAMHALEEIGYPLVLTIYDECVAEPKRARQPDAEEYAACMVAAATAQPFARDWPVRADAWIDTRFKKD